ncbi:MAG: hypothetical protein LBB89_04250 [Treponema sp.]|jgi:hypothetical protein|nr:hypothetical protein [Treponema sp.]
MNKKYAVTILMVCVLVLGACFSPWKGDEGAFSISIGETAGGGGTLNRQAALGDELKSSLLATITLSGGPGPDQKRSGLKEGQTVHFSVVSGQWTITIDVIIPDTEQAGSYEPFARGSLRVNIKPGPNGVITIPMEGPTVTVNDEDSLRKAINKYNDKPYIQSFVIEIDVAEIILSQSITVENGKHITIKARKPVTIKRGDQLSASLFIIKAIQDVTDKIFTTVLTLGGAGSASITIDGNKNFISSPPAAGTVTAPLITVGEPFGGELVMNERVTLQNNKNIPTTAGVGGSGGAVLVTGSGPSGGHSVFRMYGGTISGNDAVNGGGVYVDQFGQFEIFFPATKESVSGNTASDTSSKDYLNVCVSPYTEAEWSIWIDGTPSIGW